MTGKAVLLSVNPDLVKKGRRFSTIRSVVTALDRHFDLTIATVGDYDFASGKIRAFRRTRGGRFSDLGMIDPEADIWIVYSDGYWLDHRELGFVRQADFLVAQRDFHLRHLEKGGVRRVINSPDAEYNTRKSWLVAASSGDSSVIPTFHASTVDAVLRLWKEHGTIVAKPDWGGAGTGVKKLASEADVLSFCGSASTNDCRRLGDYCFQPYLPGDEIRFWFLGDRCVGARRQVGRKTPWSPPQAHYAAYHYRDPAKEGYERHVTAALELWRKAGLSFGSVDFLGDRINELNGAGTVFTQHVGTRLIVDNREALVRYLLEQVRAG